MEDASIRSQHIQSMDDFRIEPLNACEARDSDPSSLGRFPDEGPPKGPSLRQFWSAIVAPNAVAQRGLRRIIRLSKTWFITGASRGFGALIAAQALKAADNIVEPKEVTRTLGTHTNLLAVPLDVSGEVQAHEAAGAGTVRFARMNDDSIVCA